jgi:RNA polymerase sigma-70 factor (ECF subfamily)
VCRRITGSGSDADDAAQEAMIGIVRGLRKFDGRSAFATWVYRIATNAALDELRRRRRRPPLHVVEDEGGRELVDATAERQVDAVAERAALDAALNGLADDFKAAVVLRDVADLDYAEIAEILQIPVGTVKSRIARGRMQLASELGNPDPLAQRPSKRPPISPPSS